MPSKEDSHRRLGAAWEKTTRWGLLLAIFLLPVLKSVDLPMIGPRLTIVEVVLLPVTTLWLLGTIRDFRPQAPRLLVDYLLAGFLLVSIASGWTVLHEQPTTIALVQFGFEIFTFVYLVLFFVMARGFLAEPSFFKTSLYVWLLALGVVSFLGLIGIGELFLCHRPLSALVNKDNARLILTLRNPNQAALYLLPTMLFFGALWFSGQELPRWRRWLPIVLLVAVIALYFTGSKGGWMGWAAGMIPLVWIGWRQRRTWISLGIVLLVVLGLWFAVSVARTEGNVCLRYLARTTYAVTVDLPSVMDTLSQRAVKWLSFENLGKSVSITTSKSPEGGEGVAIDESPEGEESIDLDSIDLEAIDSMRGGYSKTVSGRTISGGVTRLILANYTLRIVKKHPLIGIGLGTMELYMDELTGIKPTTAHNTFLTLWAETGSIGVLFFAGAILLSLLTGLRNIRQAHTPFERAVGWGLLSALLGLLVIGLTHDAQRQRLMWLLMAMIFAQRERLRCSLDGQAQRESSGLDGLPLTLPADG
ncbi:MAG: O-antigen ligase family protein [Anaerolineae bacterium]|nr:O-antigen ligase family protein [Anaerolineae bacterium]